jgi:aspartyl-tRNA(Asn)/glutamyl-tRNA(Gln) amidotransferase subunit C
MTKFNIDDVLKLANLANIYVSRDEAEQFVGELGNILDYVDQLKDLDLSNTEPTYQVTGLSNVERPDEMVDYGITTKELLKNAPVTENNYIKVKRVL